MKYLGQLDGVRAIAVLMVLVAHFSPWLKRTWIANFELARLGVLSFFVLSGLLITSILLNYRDAVIRGEMGLGTALKLFITRRTLRIFPLYYGVLILFGFVLGVPRVRADIWWHLTYTTNFGMAFEGRTFSIANHFWSLCVEEQFYLVWPLVILLAGSAQKLSAIVATALLLSLAASFSWCALAGSNVFGDAMTIGGPSFALVAGSLLAMHFHSGCRDRTLLRLDRPHLVLIAGGLLFVLVSLVAHRISGKLELFLRDLAWPLVCVWILHRAVQGRIPFLAWPPLRWLGKISYGIYVYHLLLTIFFTQLFARIGVARDDDALLTLGIKIGFVVLVAAASYYLFEAPILRLKDRIARPPMVTTGGSST